MEKIGVIGAGITGLFSALNLALDGYDVTLFDREYILSGTSGKFHGMLHSGSRYSVNDNESARECIRENTLLSNTASSKIIKNNRVEIYTLRRPIRSLIYPTDMVPYGRSISPSDGSLILLRMEFENK